MTILEIQTKLKELIKKMEKYDEDQEEAAKYLKPALDSLNKSIQKIRTEGIELEPFPFE